MYSLHVDWRERVLRLAGQLVFRRYLLPVLVRLLRRFALDVDSVENRLFRPGFRMLQLWVRNALPHDARDVRCDVEWRREPSSLDTRSTRGLWLRGLASDMANFAVGAAEEVDLPANGRVEHLGLLVKYENESQTYLVTPNAYHAFMENKHWRISTLVISAGSYSVILRFTARGGERTTIRLRVTIPPDASPVACEVVSHRSE